jgi:hypothetical protein
MIPCLRTVDLPAGVRERYFSWIAEGRQIREAHAILAELILERVDPGSGESVVLTLWPSHDVFDAWIATPERTALTASERSIRR